MGIYFPVGRMETLDAALELAARGVEEIFPVHAEAVIHGRSLADQYPGLTARELLHLATSQLHRIRELKTFDPNLLAAFRKKPKKS